MKIIFWCDNGANIHSERSETMDAEDFGLSDEEWMALSDDERNELVREWAMEHFDYGWREK